MAEMWDYTAQPMSFAAMRSAGCTVVARYVSPWSYGAWKNMTQGEAQQIRNNGFDLVTNFEGYADFRTEPGYDGVPAHAGRDHARIAYDQHHACGGPDWASVKFSFDVPGLDGPTCEQYLLGALDTGLPIFPDAYAKHAVLDYLRTSKLLQVARRSPWMTSSWNYNAGVAPDAALHQFGYLNAYDRNHILMAYYGGWSQAGNPNQQQQTGPEEDEMYIVEVDKHTVPGGANWPGDFLLTGNGQLIHIPPAQNKTDGTGQSSNIDGLTAAGIKKGFITYQFWQQLTQNPAPVSAAHVMAEADDTADTTTKATAKKAAPRKATGGKS